MIEPGDYVTTTTGHSGKIRTICSDNFIVIQQENSQCYVCSKSMIIGEENTYIVPEDIDLKNDENILPADIQAHDISPKKTNKKIKTTPEHSININNKSVDTDIRITLDKTMVPVKKEKPFNEKKDNEHRKRTKRMSMDTALSHISNQKKRKHDPYQLNIFDLFENSNM